MEAAEGRSSWWSADYLRQVASRVDEVALMTYDTALWTSSAYTGFVRAETVAAAVRGVRLALPEGTPTHRAFGVALYVDFAATPADWSAYDSGWD